MVVNIQTVAQSVLEHNDSIVMDFNLGSYYVCTQVKGSQYDILMDGLLKSGITSAKDLDTTLEGILGILCSFCTLKCYVFPVEKQL